ncbi:hypothetical protein KIT04_038 [Vibrio phage KIT04]|nr:hypothetical protein KIT04_038 [Vibrio phage KIT04]
MIKVVKGDMVKHLQSKDRLDAYAHQCNCFCRMGRGIAPLLAKAVPGLRKADDMTVPGDKSKLGTFSFTEYKDSGTLVYNLYGQYHWIKHKVAPGRNTDYQALRECLVNMKIHLIYANRGSVKDSLTLGLPLIGCGLAGGDWDGVVFPMIEEVFDNSGIDVTIFKL